MQEARRAPAGFFAFTVLRHDSVTLADQDRL
jgi:hypothetical protein